jgi:hypothetical protein
VSPLSPTSVPTPLFLLLLASSPLSRLYMTVSPNDAFKSSYYFVYPIRRVNNHTASLTTLNAWDPIPARPTQGAKPTSNETIFNRNQ